jgi:hypothetical protein
MRTFPPGAFYLSESGAGQAGFTRAPQSGIF